MNKPWLRLYVDIIHNAKIRSRLSPEERWVWIALLCAVRESPVIGEFWIARGVKGSTEDLADIAAVPFETAERALSKFEQLQMITRTNDGAIAVTNWADRQFESDTSTPRVRRYRERKQTASAPTTGNVKRYSNVSETFQKRESDVSETPPDIQITDQQITEDHPPSISSPLLDGETFQEQTAPATETKSKVRLAVDELGEAIDFWNRNFYPIRPYDCEKLYEFVEEGAEPALVLHALKRACEAGKRTLAYVTGIMRNYMGQGIFTLADAIYADEHRVRRPSNSGLSPPPESSVVVRHEYHSDEYVREAEQLTNMVLERLKIPGGAGQCGSRNN